MDCSGNDDEAVSKNHYYTFFAADEAVAVSLVLGYKEQYQSPDRVNVERDEQFEEDFS